MSQAEELLEKIGVESEKDLTPEELGVYNAIKKLERKDFDIQEIRKFFLKEYDMASEKIIEECYNNNVKKDMFFRAYARLCKKFIKQVDLFYTAKNIEINKIVK